jgi:hypothetical protein
MSTDWTRRNTQFLKVAVADLTSEPFLERAFKRSGNVKESTLMVQVSGQTLFQHLQDETEIRPASILYDAHHVTMAGHSVSLAGMVSSLTMPSSLFSAPRLDS